MNPKYPSKSHLRRQIKQLSSQIAIQNLTDSQKIIDKLLTHPAFLSANIIASYQPLPDEVDITKFNQSAQNLGKFIAYPVCHDTEQMDMCDSKFLCFDATRRTASTLATKPVTTGLRKRRQHRGIYYPTHIDLVIIPCRAFDTRTHHRLGRGGGHYDRYLAHCPRAVTIIVAYELQKIPNLPHDLHDIPVDLIITEQNIYD